MRFRKTLFKLDTKPSFHLRQFFRRGLITVIPHNLLWQPPYRPSSVIAVIAQIPIRSRKNMPVQMCITVPKTLIIDFVCLKRSFYSFRNYHHFLQKSCSERNIQIKKLHRMSFTDEQRISVEMLIQPKIA